MIKILIGCLTGVFWAYISSTIVYIIDENPKVNNTIFFLLLFTIAVGGSIATSAGLAYLLGL